MCTGAELALVAAAVGGNVGGSIMQSKSQAKKRQAQMDAAQAEMARQGRMEDQRAASFQEALDLARRGNQQENIDEAAGERQELMQRSTGLPQQMGDYESPASRSTPRVVQDYAAGAQSDANDFATQMGLARAQLGAWGEGMLPFQEGLRDTTFDMDEVARRMAESARIGGMEASAASQAAGNKEAMYGNIMTQIGQGASQAAGAKMGGQGGTFAPAPKPTGGYYYGGSPGGLY